MKNFLDYGLKFLIEIQILIVKKGDLLKKFSRNGIHITREVDTEIGMEIIII